MKFSKRFKRLGIFSLILNILHGVEVSQTKFFLTNPDFYPYTKYFDTIPEAVYYVQHGGLYAIICTIICFVAGGRRKYIPLVRLGLLNTFEVHHFAKAMMGFEYTSGAITSLLFLPLAYLYRKEFYKLIQSDKLS